LILTALVSLLKSLLSGSSFVYSSADVPGEPRMTGELDLNTHGDLFEKRCVLMKEWADYCSMPNPAAPSSGD
jgi:hypothetical protein